MSPVDNKHAAQIRAGSSHFGILSPFASASLVTTAAASGLLATVRIWQRPAQRSQHMKSQVKVDPARPRSTTAPTCAATLLVSVFAAAMVATPARSDDHGLERQGRRHRGRGGSGRRGGRDHRRDHANERNRARCHTPVDAVAGLHRRSVEFPHLCRLSHRFSTEAGKEMGRKIGALTVATQLRGAVASAQPKRRFRDGHARISLGFLALSRFFQPSFTTGGKPDATDEPKVSASPPSVMSPIDNNNASLLNS